MSGTFVGFGFGAIQTGLFLYEAHKSGNFDRLVVAEVMPDTVAAVRNASGRFFVNIASSEGIRQDEVGSVELFNPAVAEDRNALVEAVSQASEIATALPSVDFFDKGGPASVSGILRDGLKKNSGRAVIYAAENHNHAAEILAEKTGVSGNADYLNTVIGKMSGIVTDPGQMKAQGLKPVTPGANRAFLVEEFNRILISKCRWTDFRRMISVFQEKDDLLPFEEAKLYGHNAVHALIGYLLSRKNEPFMCDASRYPDIIRFAREAFLLESGSALCRKFAGVDPLFTEKGYADYAEDLIRRMLNPFLKDQVARITRDHRRKLGWDDRLIGTMRVALSQGIEPVRFAFAAKTALSLLAREEGVTEAKTEGDIWRDFSSHPQHADIVRLVSGAGSLFPGL